MLIEIKGISIIILRLSTYFGMTSFIFIFFLDMIYFTVISTDIPLGLIVNW